MCPTIQDLLIKLKQFLSSLQLVLHPHPQIIFNHFYCMVKITTHLYLFTSTDNSFASKYSKQRNKENFVELSENHIVFPPSLGYVFIIIHFVLYTLFHSLFLLYYFPFITLILQFVLYYVFIDLI